MKALTVAAFLALASLFACSSGPNKYKLTDTQLGLTAAAGAWTTPI